MFRLVAILLGEAQKRPPCWPLHGVAGTGCDSCGWERGCIDEGFRLYRNALASATKLKAQTDYKAAYEEALRDKLQLANTLDIAIHGETNTTGQALRDLIPEVHKMRQALEFAVVSLDHLRKTTPIHAGGRQKGNWLRCEAALDVCRKVLGIKEAPAND